MVRVFSPTLWVFIFSLCFLSFGASAEVMPPNTLANHFNCSLGATYQVSVALDVSAADLKWIRDSKLQSRLQDVIEAKKLWKLRKEYDELAAAHEETKFKFIEIEVAYIQSVKKAVNYINDLDYSVHKKALLWESFAVYFEAYRPDEWVSVPYFGTNGEYLYVGESHYCLLFKADGLLFKGQLTDQKFISFLDAHKNSRVKIPDGNIGLWFVSRQSFDDPLDDLFIY